MTERKEQQINSDELRRRAEERLGEKTGTARLPGAVDETLRLNHELQVHQIELEIQNAELCKVRDELETSLEQYTDLYDFAPVGYFTLERTGTISRVNLTGAGLLAVERSRLVGQRLRHFVTVEARPDFNAFLEKVFTSPAKETCEVELLHKENDPRYVLVEGVAAQSRQECRVALTDITEKKLAEVALRKMEEAAEVALRKVEEAAEVALQKVEVTVYKALENADALEALPQTIEAAANEARKIVEEATKEACRKIIEAAKIAEALLRVQGVTDLKKGEQSAEIARHKVEDATVTAGNKVNARTLVHQTWAEASDKLWQKKVSAEAASQAKSQFLANMSHELRTPMTGILGMLQLALGENLAPSTRRYLHSTMNSARSLLRILNDILDMSKFEAGKLTLEEQPFSPQLCFSEVVNNVTPEILRKGLDFVISVDKDMPKIMVGDELRLKQVLINLIGNAIKFTDKGKVEVRVTAGEVTSDGKREFTFAVSDTGIGVPSDKKEALFQTFSQVDASHSRLYGGTGLGLSISKGIVELMGGTISLVSEVGVGSTFTFTIPLKETDLEHDDLSADDSFLPEEVTTSQEVERPRVLVAEDDSTIREILGDLLKMANYDVDIAEDGLKAVEMWEKGGYDIVLLDVQMPRLDGFGASRAIREKELEKGGHTPIVAMTAHSHKKDEANCLAAGMDAYISKPIDFKESLRVIGDIIKKTATP
jgi:signal transduction histidine kinase/PAS domain-containing protein/ActR/RegA family two-component response regulator